VDVGFDFGGVGDEESEGFGFEVLVGGGFGEVEGVGETEVVEVVAEVVGGVELDGFLVGVERVFVQAVVVLGFENFSVLVPAGGIIGILLDVRLDVIFCCCGVIFREGIARHFEEVIS